MTDTADIAAGECNVTDEYDNGGGGTVDVMADADATVDGIGASVDLNDEAEVDGSDIATAAVDDVDGRSSLRGTFHRLIAWMYCICDVVFVVRLVTAMIHS